MSVRPVVLLIITYTTSLSIRRMGKCCQQQMYEASEAESDTAVDPRGAVLGHGAARF